MRVWIFLLLGCAGWAQGLQNMEILWMVGGAGGSSAVVTGTNATISGSAGFATQISYGYQVASTKAGNLWIEVPMTFIWRGTGTISGSTVATIDRDSWMMTPGLRLKSPTYGRVSFYGALGGGFGSFSIFDSVVSGANGTSTGNSTLHFSPVFDYAGGIDVRLSRSLSLRGEGRDFVSAPNLSGDSGHNHFVALVGLVFHL